MGLIVWDSVQPRKCVCFSPSLLPGLYSPHSDPVSGNHCSQLSTQLLGFCPLPSCLHTEIYSWQWSSLPLPTIVSGTLCCLLVPFQWFPGALILGVLCHVCSFQYQGEYHSNGVQWLSSYPGSSILWQSELVQSCSAEFARGTTDLYVRPLSTEINLGLAIDAWNASIFALSRMLKANSQNCPSAKYAVPLTGSHQHNIVWAEIRTLE